MKGFFNRTDCYAKKLNFEFKQSRKNIYLKLKISELTFSNSLRDLTKRAFNQREIFCY